MRSESIFYCFRFSLQQSEKLHASSQDEFLWWENQEVYWNSPSQYLFTQTKSAAVTLSTEQKKGTFIEKLLLRAEKKKNP